VVDPGDGDAALAGAEARGWTIDQVLITHWHPDHTGGIERVKAATDAQVWGPEAERHKFAGLDHGLADGDQVRVGPWTSQVWAVPGHTLGHIAYIFPKLSTAFVGDTLFAMGCGRLFEGTPQQMFESLKRLGGLPGDTLTYPAHEYTLSNARFSAHAEPGNEDIAKRLSEVEGTRAAGGMTLPTSIAQELATNPFMRARDVEQFAALRSAKDSFR
jgi:hydroxyacylglutathione hydrolase